MYKPVTEVSRLLAPEYAVISSLCSGYIATNGPSEAAVILPLPIPVAIAKDSGLIGRSDANSPDVRPRNIAPNIVPKIYMETTPRPSGEDMPYFSDIKARFA